MTSRHLSLDGNHICDNPRAIEGTKALTQPFGSVVRNRGLQLRSARVRRLRYVEVGLLLRQVGFGRVLPRSYREGGDPLLLIDSPDRAAESLYIEASVTEQGSRE